MLANNFLEDQARLLFHFVLNQAFKGLSVDSVALLATALAFLTLEVLFFLHDVGGILPRQFNLELDCLGAAESKGIGGLKISIVFDYNGFLVLWAVVDDKLL